MTSRQAFALGLLSLGGCAAGASSARDGSGPGNAECTVKLTPRASVPPRSAPLPEPPTPESQVMVHAELPLAPLRRTLEERVPKHLSDGRVRIGPGGTVSYSVERGALSLRVTSSALLIEAPARAKAQACRGDDCYASCEPEARVTVEVPLMLGPDFRFQKTYVSLSFTRGCKIRALGGFFTLDITPTLEAQLAPELEKVAREIDPQLPDLRPRIAQAWSELAKPRPLPLGGCFELQPFGVTQGPFAPSTTSLNARFAVHARPELRPACSPASSINPLPTLKTNPALPEEGVLRLGMVTPLEGVARAFESAPNVKQAHVTARGRNIDAELTLAGRVCGDVALEATPDFSGDGQYIGFSHAALVEDAPVDVVALAAAARMTPLLSVRGFQDSAPALAKSLSQPGVEVRATVSSARAAGASARSKDLVAWLEAHGAIWLKAESLPER
jgi:hypothetical protein